ncbi:hypothetical protein SBD_2149 [Streptomyces bottropensis ATCC 25435]|uniref:Uncharacterized protein n=1 Tax=Streptomyces bottropensis ATCC 25435 TaxID=1054862 RepID=M3F4A5_9ACTN|nr:hypothetical protein SBD_2149 [Streptomyces bottropensis ATCC 25435]
MSDDLPVAVRDEKEPGRVVYAGSETCRSELARPTHVDARISRPGIFGKQRAAACDQAIHIGWLGTADDDLMLLITHAA